MSSDFLKYHITCKIPSLLIWRFGVKHLGASTPTPIPATRRCRQYCIYNVICNITCVITHQCCGRQWIFFFFHIGDFFAQVSNTFFTTDGPGWINPFGKRKNCRASLGKDWKQKHLCFLLILHSDPDMRSYGARYIFNRHSSNSSLQIHCFWPPSWRRSKTCERAANLIWRSHQFVSFWFLRDRRFYKRLRQIRPWASEGCLSPICSKSNLEWKSSQDFCTLLLCSRYLFRRQRNVIF